MSQFQSNTRRLSQCNLLAAFVLSLSILFAPNPAKASNNQDGSGSALILVTIVATQLYLMNAQAIIGLLNSPVTVLKTNDGMNNALTRRLLYAMISNPRLTQALISRMSKLQKDRLREAFLEREIKQISALIDVTNIIASGLGATHIPESQGSRRSFILAGLLARARLINAGTTNTENERHLEAVKRLVALDHYYNFVNAWLKVPNVGPKG